MSLLIACIGVLPSVMTAIRSYGLNLIANSNQVYVNAITNTNSSDNSGFSLENFIYLAIIFSGVYVKKYGVALPVISSLIMAMLSQLTSGSRGGLFVQILLLLGPTLLLTNKKKSTKKTSFGLKTLIFCSIIFLFVITYLRKSTLVNLPYANPKLRLFGNFSTMIYNITFYFTSPIATLNEFVQNTVHTFWGAATFRPFYLVFNSLGLVKYDVDFINIYLFYSPLPANVVSFMGELILDFGFVGGGFGVFIFSYIFGISYKKTRLKNNSISWIIILDICFSLTGLSFFAWFLRPTYLWFSLIVGIFIAILIKNQVINRDERKNKC
jgi:oligosaccharide repeat unit polymerase